LLQAKQASEEELGSKERLSQQAESVTDKADLLLKQQVIEELKNQLHENETSYSKKIKSLSSELAKVEANSAQASRSIINERQSYNTTLQSLQSQLQTSYNENSELKNSLNEQTEKSKRLNLRLETVQKYMELLPTREEHIKLEKNYEDLCLKEKNYLHKIDQYEDIIDNFESDIKSRDENLANLVESSNELREKLNQTSKALDQERSERKLNQQQLTNAERQKLQQLTRENARLKNEIEKQAKLNGAMSSKLNHEKKDIESKETESRLELARERAVAETLRQALIDKQIEIEKLENVIESLEERSRKKDQEISHLKIELDDVADVVKTSEKLQESNSVLSDAARDMRTIVSIFDRHIVKSSHYSKNDDQDILDVSRLLSCSLDTKIKPKKLSNKTAFTSADEQLKSALELRSEIDDLRLKLSDKWTEHLTSDCHVQ